MSKLKYSNIEVPELEIDEIDPIIYFSVVQCPNCQVILDNEKNLKVTRTSFGRSGFYTGTEAVARCKCSHCKTTFDVSTTITSKFSVGLFVHTILWILIIISLIFGVICGIACGVCSLYGSIHAEAKILVKPFGYLTGTFAVIFFGSLFGGSVLETCNNDCIKYFDK